MGRLSTTSNPTGLVEIDRSRVGISVADNGGQRRMHLVRLDLTNLGFNDNLKVIGIARAGRTSRRIDLGTVANWKKESHTLDGLDRSSFFRFRVLIRDAMNPQLVASVEGLRPISSQDSESLLPMEPAELGQLLWRVDILESEGPVLRFNSKVFPSAAGAENYLPFRALVLPEAIRQVLTWIAKQPEGLEDDGDPRIQWAGWLDALGAGRPPQDEDEREQWCSEVVGKFCDRFVFADTLASTLREATTHD